MKSTSAGGIFCCIHFLFCLVPGIEILLGTPTLFLRFKINLWFCLHKQKQRGIANIKEFEIEYHKRIAMSFASFILTVIGVSLSSRKTKGGMGLHLGIGLGLSFSYILFQTVASTFAVNGNMPPMIAMWIPNLLYALIAFYLYRKAPK